MTPRLPRPTGSEVIAALRLAGFDIVRIKGSPHFLQHPDRRVTVASGHAAATAHMVGHSQEAAAHAVKDVRLMVHADDAAIAGDREQQWQRQDLPERIRELLLSVQE